MQTIAKILYYGTFVVVLILGLLCGRFISKAFSGEIESKDAVHVYQFQDGVLIYKFKMPTRDWGGGGLDQMYFLDDATDVYLMVGNQGKWVKGGLKDEPPAQAVLDRWNRKQEWETVKPLREGYHEVIRANESADEDTTFYPPLQPSPKNKLRLKEQQFHLFNSPPTDNPVDEKGRQKFETNLPSKPWTPVVNDEPVTELPPPPAPPKPIVKQLKEKIQEHRRERYVFQKIGDGTFLLNNEDGRVWKLYDYDGTTKWVMTKDKDQ